ncbi:MAG: sodium-extruding oxaloacetate decarboxylase subunit alpha [Methanosphaera sp.]|uniref:sodium-extruding oxaloacetate decarboxylase subunit alpha n=1 Tax=Methanosphaera sp. TaxID=2666342 RepID=UPI0025E32A0D|nr:sodium-extruding oxaloacetate decarboxylase subunit alpha [Methanosphaera sp.]MCI5867279.1 sodium-extruding oxaloacetate decarboxylase subunit alpha [Methanosphaera sp.]MDD6534653.1 sodium-extruding oxaloacetate decarboxylase subunit alpha [Methanosphaera sp.]MDY3955679.1 sodium-extruding oxaloacetate decarboxylase subunit alpha [Methanosphaera sp.]
MARVKIIETALRDAHQSLIATRMRTEDMVPILEDMDKVGYFSLEAWGGATFDTCIRFLNEDPWERLRTFKDNLSKTPIQMLLRGQNLVGYKHYADDMVESFVEKSYENGVDVFRIFDALNDVRNMETAIKSAKDQGAYVLGTISYTISPVHTIESYVDFAGKLAELECDAITIKDMAGLITPGMAHDLVSAIKDEYDLEVNLHSHCTSGMTLMSYEAAVEAGVDMLDTAISPFSGGTSQPPTESVVAALAGGKYDTGIDLEDLNPVKVYFEELNEKYNALFDPLSAKVDADVLRYQVPGGMLSNLVSQLKQQDAIDKYDEVLKEIPEVRRDLGYPPLVTPTSQIVGVQSVMNVLSGERYSNITKEVKDYLKGEYGRPPAEIDEELYKKANGDEERITCRPADLIEPELEKAEAEAQEKGLIKKPEDVLTYAMYPTVAEKFLKGEAVAEEIPEPKVEYTASSIPTSYDVEVDGETFNVKVLPSGYMEMEPASQKIKESVEGGLTASMQGMIVKLKVNVGDNVEIGDTVAVLEAMKMENDVKSDKAGKVTDIFIAEGDTVDKDEVLMVIK